MNMAGIRPGALVRIRPDILCRIILTIICSSLVTGLVNFDRMIYRKEVKTAGYNNRVGYPAGEDVIRVESMEEMLAHSRFTLEIPSSSLEPTGYYRGIYKDFGTNAVGAFFRRFEGDACGQYYIAELASGEKVVLFLDDRVLNLSGKTIVLPVGNIVHRIPVKLKTEWKTAYDLSADTWIVDMAGTWWRHTHTASSLPMLRGGLLLLSFILFGILWTYIFHKAGLIPQKHS